MPKGNSTFTISLTYNGKATSDTTDSFSGNGAEIVPFAGNAVLLTTASSTLALYASGSNADLLSVRLSVIELS